MDIVCGQELNSELKHFKLPVADLPDLAGLAALPIALASAGLQDAWTPTVAGESLVAVVTTSALAVGPSAIGGAEVVEGPHSAPTVEPVPACLDWPSI